ncbi:uncharacterized protein K441DRAFT_660582 [Cenococcum geophilum 1.58]|uniref:uncharacterized protein n=1 Tax=Cenococcum geophilum 1.58 TaxID=794803 RepID=UPI00358EA343|nr:hypothetical protein K441DRAFT_660582 [Cenococcum geophilum 1.58]
MANKVKTYFLVPGWDFPVGSIQLGAVITDPAFPHRALNEDDLVPIDTKIHPSDKYDFSSTIDKSRSNKFGLWAQFLQIFGLGGELSVAFDKGAIDKYSFKHMHTEWFLPSAAFAKACVKVPNVADFLEQTEYKKPVYVITGLKTVEGASVTTAKSKGRGLKAKLGFDGTPPAVPITVSPEAEHQNNESETDGFENSSAIVFAFQLSKVASKEGGQNVSVKEHTKGALYGVREKKKVDLETEVAASVKLEGREIVPVVDEDGEEVCNCVLPDMAAIDDP